MLFLAAGFRDGLSRETIEAALSPRPGGMSFELRSGLDCPRQAHGTVAWNASLRPARGVRDDADAVWRRHTATSRSGFGLVFLVR